jgi:hypothetical protein
MSLGHFMRREPNGEPKIDQGQLNGWFLTWNPDDDRFYVSPEDDGVAVATFARFTNATRYARTHVRKEQP